MCCGKAAPGLLVHVTMLLLVYSGVSGLVGCLMMLYLRDTFLEMLNLMLPNVVLVTECTLLAAAGVTVLLSHLAAVAARASGSLARALFITYALMMVLVVVGELAWVSYSMTQASAFENLRSKAEKLPLRMRGVGQVASAPVPAEVYVLGGVFSVVLVLRLTAVALAIAAARARPS